jgi:ATP-dependent Clp protease ATP-binding subunit ClpB
LRKKLLSGNIDKTKPVLVDVFDGMVVFRNDVNTPEPNPVLNSDS